MITYLVESNHELLLPPVNEENACLPLPINVVSKYWGVELSIIEAEENCKRYPGFGGSILIEGIELAERSGLSCLVVHITLDGLKRIIDAGIPPIVILPGIPEITQHASVISGYDAENNTILHYIQTGTQDGEQQEGAIPQDVFEREWSEDGNLAIILAPQHALVSAGMQEDNSTQANRLCLESERFNIQNDHVAALDALKKAASLDNGNSTVLQMLGAALSAQNSAECVSYYEKCLAVNEKCYLACNGLGNYYLKSGKFEDAESFYTRAIGINPKRSAKIYKNRAYLLEKKHKNSQAADDLREYLRLYPRAEDRGIIEQAIRELGA